MLWYGISEWLSYRRRRKELLQYVREVITQEGGSIERVTLIGLMIRSPFRPINPYPVYFRLYCTYPLDRGCWFVCGSADKEIQWAWKSDLDRDELPTPRENAKVNNSIIVLPAWVNILVYLAMVAGIFYVIFFAF